MALRALRTMVMKVLRDRPQWIIFGTIVLAAAIGGTVRILTAPPTQTATQPQAAPEVPEAVIPADDASVELFESPMVELSAELRKAATPSELLSSTASQDRLSVISAGRVDPFAPITRSIGATAKPPAAEATTAVTGVDPSIANLPTAPVSSRPDLPPVPTVTAAPPPLPSIPVATRPLSIPALPTGFPQANPVPQNPVQAIELTGVIQVGDRVGIIVRESNGQTSRHLFEGDLLAGGQVRIKSIDMSTQQPLVILEYQGKEYPRMVG